MRKIIEEKVKKLNEARAAYEQYDIELMTNAEYDALYDELEALEKACKSDKAREMQGGKGNALL